MLLSQICGRDKDLCKGISDTAIKSATGTDSVIKAVYKRDDLSIMNGVYQNFINLLNTKRGSSESFKNSESRFDAQVSKFNANYA